MLKFLKYLLASILGTLLTFVIIFFIILGIASASTSKDPIVVKDNSILKINLTKIIQDRQPINPLADFGISGDEGIQGLNKIKAAIEAAKKDDKIKGIYLDAGVFTGGGLATIEEIRNALIDFKSSGKFIIAYGENYNQKAYYLSTVADKIYLNPMGMVDFKGLYAQIMFFKNAMEKLDINMQIIRGPGNKFKSAVEPFLLDHMSEANKKQTEVFLGTIWNNILDNISKSRNISTENLQTIANNLTTFDASKAEKSGIIDKTLFWNEVEDDLKQLTNTDSDKKLNFITIADYSKTVRKANRKAKKKIAIIYASGTIESGEGDDQSIGSDRIAKAIRKARQDSSIAAVVLRVNSPGGSAQASEVIYQELLLTKKVKPLVVSMGDLAASGGYYISCLADKIYAHPNTITGSIGVFGMIPNIKNFVNNTLGITFDGVKTAENADIMTSIEPLTPYQTETIRHTIDVIYKTFIGHVAEGRNMTTIAVDSIGQGRVWSGTDALKIGLVDELGGINEAIAAAAELANITEYKITELPVQKSPFDDFLKKIGAKTSIETTIDEQLGAYANYYQFFKSLNSTDIYQARLPYIIEIQ